MAKEKGKVSKPKNTVESAGKSVDDMLLLKTMIAELAEAVNGLKAQVAEFVSCADGKSNSEKLECDKLKIHENFIAEAKLAYKRKGTMFNYIDSISALNQKEKAELYVEAMARTKGVPPKNNPFE